MEWVVGIAINLVSAVIGWLAHLAYLRWWNPDRWTLSLIDHDKWRLSRVSGPSAIGVRLAGGGGPGHPRLLSLPDEMLEEGGVHKFDAPPGGWLQYSGMVSAWTYRLAWYEGSKRKYATIDTHSRDTTYVRRREVKAFDPKIAGNESMWPA